MNFFNYIVGIRSPDVRDRANFNKVWRKFKHLHPDVNKDPLAIEKFKCINSAIEDLKSWNKNNLPWVNYPGWYDDLEPEPEFLRHWSYEEYLDQLEDQMEEEEKAGAHPEVIKRYESLISQKIPRARRRKSKRNPQASWTEGFTRGEDSSRNFSRSRFGSFDREDPRSWTVGEEDFWDDCDTPDPSNFERLSPRMSERSHFNDPESSRSGISGSFQGSINERTSGQGVDLGLNFNLEEDGGFNLNLSGRFYNINSPLRERSSTKRFGNLAEMESLKTELRPRLDALRSQLTNRDLDPRDFRKRFLSLSRDEDMRRLLKHLEAGVSKPWHGRFLQDWKSLCRSEANLRAQIETMERQHLAGSSLESERGETSEDLYHQGIARATENIEARAESLRLERLDFARENLNLNPRTPSASVEPDRSDDDTSDDGTRSDSGGSDTRQTEREKDLALKLSLSFCCILAAFYIWDRSQTFRWFNRDSLKLYLLMASTIVVLALISYYFLLS